MYVIIICELGIKKNCLLFNLKTIVLNDNFNDFKGHLYMQILPFFKMAIF